MRIVSAIIKKQLKDTFKNKTVLIQFIMFPIFTLIINRSIKIDGMPEHFFVNLFATMYIGMAPLTSMAAIISEEKEKNTLRVLLMSNVRPQQYLFGIGSYIWVICMLGAAVICSAGNYEWQASLTFMAVMSAGILASLLIGAAIGIWSKTQMMATSVTVPLMMVFAFAPMLSMFNPSIAKAAKFTYSVQIGMLLDQIDSASPVLDQFSQHIGIIVGNMLLFTVLFAVAYKKSKLE